MALVSCPDCGAQVSDTAVVCAQCGYPLRRDALQAAAGRGGGARRNTAGIIIGLVAVGFGMIVVFGILAALAIPRFTAAAGRVKEIEGEMLLKQAYTLENTYYANNGVWAPSVEELRSVGWAEADSGLYYTLEIRLAPAAAGLLCLEARPKRGAGVQPLSMDSLGVIHRGAGCTGETVRHSRSSVFTPPAPDDAPGEGGEAGARTLLREVYAGMAEYRAKHGRDATDLGQVLQHVHFTRAMTENTLSVTRSGGRVCVVAEGNSGGYALSVDGEGRLYRGGDCSGAVLEQLDSAPPADSTSS